MRVVSTPYTPLQQRHARWLRRFSTCLELHEAHYQIVLGADAAADLSAFLAGRLGFPVPHLKPHRGRKLNTGRCEPSRAQLAAAFGEAKVAASERRRGRPYPEWSVVRFGNPTLAGVVSHELAHCHVHAADGVETPGHGRVWVRRYDETARLTAQWAAARAHGPDRMQHPGAAVERR